MAGCAGLPMPGRARAAGGASTVAPDACLFASAGIPLREAAPDATPAPAAIARPDAPAGTRCCANCPTLFTIRPGARKLFCCAKCEIDYRNLLTVRGRQSMLLVMAARQTRDGTRGTPARKAAGLSAVRQLNALLQDWRDADRAAGRADAIDVFALRERLGRADK